MNRTRRIVGNILISLSGLLLVASAAAKFAGVPKVVSELGSMGFHCRQYGRAIYSSRFEFTCRD
jgi:hypothetical protein